MRELRLIATYQLDSFHSMPQRTRFWLQSVVFLAAVTLSAAIIQGRWSPGTLGSKYDKLWLAGELATAINCPALHALQLRERVLALARQRREPAIDRWIAVRSLFEQAVHALAQGAIARTGRVRASAPETALGHRFGFVDLLRQQVPGLQALIVYGSSLSSAHFADYDVIAVVEDACVALRTLHDAKLHWAGKELNLSIYNASELWQMQLLSGDNLADVGVCLYGEVELPDKPVGLLLARNLSFGMVRQRQQLGMIASALVPGKQAGDDRRNLHDYFVKIPANVVKGTFGAQGQRRAKEDVQRWLVQNCGFDAVTEQARAAGGASAAALANAAVATGSALQRLNDELRIVEAT